MKPTTTLPAAGVAIVQLGSPAVLAFIAKLVKSVPPLGTSTTATIVEVAPGDAVTVMLAGDAPIT